MTRAAFLAILTALLFFPACRAKAPARPLKATPSRAELYKPLPTPAPPRALPGQPTPKKPLPD